MGSVADVIKEITNKHLTENNGALLSQNVRAVGNLCGTISDETINHKGIIELPTSDSSNGGIACGFGLMGRRPIYAIRFQGFLWYNAVSIINYAAKVKQLSNGTITCPIFVRGIGTEGNIGPVASHQHHGMMLRGSCDLKVFAPMTPNEYKATWKEFMDGNVPVFCSEHRLSYNNSEDFRNSFCVVSRQPTIIAIGAARLNALKAQLELRGKGIFVNLVHLWQLKPLVLPDSIGIATSKILIVDSDYEFGGFGAQVALECHKRYNIPVDVMGLEDRVAGFAPQCDVLTPSVERIVNHFV